MESLLSVKKMGDKVLLGGIMNFLTDPQKCQHGHIGSPFPPYKNTGSESHWMQ